MPFGVKMYCLFVHTAFCSVRSTLVQLHFTIPPSAPKIQHILLYSEYIKSGKKLVTLFLYLISRHFAIPLSTSKIQHIFVG